MIFDMEQKIDREMRALAKSRKKSDIFRISYNMILEQLT